ncbi:MAG: hypothetical protein JXA35_02130 [Deltaproteobacteria bacterium]|nr:hypothetical protein [Deltaproteobacteria bacterium]
MRRNVTNGGLEGLGAKNRRILKHGLKKEKEKGYTLYIDATGIESEKETAKMTCKGYKGYMLMVWHLAENGLIAGDESAEEVFKQT